jgi:hypothetical protein
MTVGLIAIPAQAGAQPNKVDQAAPGGVAAADGTRVKGADLPLAKRKAAKVADDDAIFVSTPGSSSTLAGKATSVVEALYNESKNESVLIWRTWSSETNSWGEWLPFNAPGSRVFGAPSISWTPDGSRLDVFVVNSTDQAVYQSTYTKATDSWSAWDSRGGFVLSSPSAVWTNNGGRIDIFAIGGDGRLYQKFWRSTGGWHEWAAVGGVPGAGIGSSPSATWTANGTRLDIFAASRDRHLQQLSWSASSGWSGWGDLGGFLESAPSAQWVGDGSRIDIFAVGGGNRLFQKFWTSARGWRDWIGIDGPATGHCCTPSITWASNGSRIDIFSLDNREIGVSLSHRAWTSTSGWSIWSDLFAS